MFGTSLSIPDRTKRPPLYPGASVALDFTKGRYRAPAKNKSIRVNINPQDTTGLVVSGDPAATLSVVTTEGAALTAAGAGQYGPNVYELNNSAGASFAYVTLSDGIGNQNAHTTQAWMRTLSGTAQLGLTSETRTSYTSSAWGKVTNTVLVPGGTTRSAIVYAPAGTVVRFVAYDMKEGVNVTPILPSATTSTPLSGFTNGWETIPGLVVTRNSVGYVEDDDGTLRLCAVNEPRIGRGKGLLIEEARTNLIRNSGDLTSGSWTTLSSPTASRATGPDLSSNAWTITDDSPTSYEGYAQANTIAADTTTYTFSVFIKKTASPLISGFNLQANGGTPVQTNTRIDTSTGTLSSGTPAGSTVRSVGDWWLISTPITNNGTNTSLAVQLYPAARESLNGPDAVTAVGSATFFGPQYEVGTFPTSYIPTAAATATRAADVVQLVGQTVSFPLTIVYEIEYDTHTPAATETIFALNDGTSLERIMHYRNAPVKDRIGLITDGGVNQAVHTEGSWGSKTVARGAHRAELNNVNASFSGGIGTTDTSATMPTVTRLNLGSENSTAFGNLYLRGIRLYPRAFSNSELQEAAA